MRAPWREMCRVCPRVRFDAVGPRLTAQPVTATLVCGAGPSLAITFGTLPSAPGEARASRPASALAGDPGAVWREGLNALVELQVLMPPDVPPVLADSWIDLDFTVLSVASQ